jgi:hypothetical protein
MYLALGVPMQIIGFDLPAFDEIWLGWFAARLHLDVDDDKVERITKKRNAGDELRKAVASVQGLADAADRVVSSDKLNVPGPPLRGRVDVASEQLIDSFIRIFKFVTGELPSFSINQYEEGSPPRGLFLDFARIALGPFGQDAPTDEAIRSRVRSFLKTYGEELSK